MWTQEILPPSRWRIPFAILLMVSAIGLGVATWQIEAWVRLPPPAVAAPSYGAFLASKAPSGEPELDVGRARVPRPMRLRRGQTLGTLLAEQGLDPAQVHSLVVSLEGQLEVRKLRPGEIGLAYLNQEGELSSLRLDAGRDGWVELVRDGTGWVGSRHRFAREVKVQRIEGELEGMLIDDILRAGGRQLVAYEMSNVLQWDLDFNRDLRTGDRFRVLYEDVYLDGELAGLGEILALTYENRGRRLEAYRFGERGYYDAAGRPLQKMFLRSPLPFTRVTSRFSHRRYHPILKVHRPHYGVDYGAPRGTGVRVTANGVVTFAGVSGGAGKMVKVRHPNGYQTSYLHLSRFAQGIRHGKAVRQGDVIGHVGSTGLSTAPHLDYRVRKNGRWLDPLRLKSDPAEPVPEHRMAQFLARHAALVAGLESGRLSPDVLPPDVPETPVVVAGGHGSVARGEAAGR